MTVFARGLQFRRLVIAQDLTAQARVGEAYREAERAVVRMLAALYRDAPNEPERALTWLNETGRLERIAAQLRGEAAAVSGRAADAVTVAQGAAVRIAQEALPALGDASLRQGAAVEWARLPIEAFQRLVGVLGDGSPVVESLSRFGDVVAARATAALRDSFAAGVNPREQAAIMRRAVQDGGGLPGNDRSGVAGQWRRLNTSLRATARTETLRAYRSASLESYQANPTIVVGWQWLAELDEVTCAACWAMHGQEFRPEDEFGTHVNCRCAPVPVVNEGISGPGQGFESGPSAFAKLSAGEQDRILGHEKAALYRAGDIRLADAVQYRDDPTWGPSRTVASTSEALANAAARPTR